MAASLFLFQQALANRSSMAVVSRDSQHCWRGRAGVAGEPELGKGEIKPR